MNQQREVHPTRPVLRQLHWLVSQVPPLLSAYRRTKRWAKQDPLVVACYRKLFERGRLTLPVLPAEDFSPAAGSIHLPAFYPLFAGEDAPLNDILFLLNLAKGREARRILEVGTFRARTTYALHLNRPEATIVSYDIQVLDSAYRRALGDAAGVELRHASFSASVDGLRRESPFDLIFVDGSHRFEDVLEDSRLALELVAPGGVIVWHDYRRNDYFDKELKVPEALTILSRTHPIYAIQHTMCAVYVKPGSASA